MAYQAGGVTQLDEAASDGTQGEGATLPSILFSGVIGQRLPEVCFPPGPLPNCLLSLAVTRLIEGSRLPRATPIYCLYPGGVLQPLSGSTSMSVTGLLNVPPSHLLTLACPWPLLLSGSPGCSRKPTAAFRQARTSRGCPCPVFSSGPLLHLSPAGTSIEPALRMHASGLQ